MKGALRAVFDPRKRQHYRRQGHYVGDRVVNTDSEHLYQKTGRDRSRGTIRVLGKKPKGLGGRIKRSVAKHEYKQGYKRTKQLNTTKKMKKHGYRFSHTGRRYKYDF